jgi:diacylglycerol kinase (ATP)
MSVIVIINPLSGPGGGSVESRERLHAGLAAHVLERRRLPHRIVVTRYAGHGAVIARDAVRDRADLIIAWGGDGTINEIASALVSGSIPLGIVPAGSGNGFARGLRLDMDRERALNDALDGRRHTIDVGELGGRLFFNLAGIGFDAHVARCFNALPGRGFARYVRTSLSELFRYQPRRYAIRCDGETIERLALMVVFANGSEYGNGARVAPDARLDDGQLDLVVVEPRAPWRDALRTRYLFDGSVGRRPGVLIRRITCAAVGDGPGPLGFHVDGEFGEAPAPITVRLHPAALTVMIRP